MAHPRKFRFGVQLSTAPSGEAWASAARKLEDLGYSTLHLPDHFGDQLAPVPAMMAAADATSTLRVGTLVFGVDYKHPVVLAKEMATIDVLSGGRVEFGLGAGWMNSDYEQAGMTMDRAGVRIQRLDEALHVIRGLWADGPCTFEGEHYRITGLDGRPKPAQKPHPPILIGGGAPKVLAVAARHADIVGINPSIPKGYVDADAAQDAMPDAVDRKLQWLRDAAGDRTDDLELNALVFATTVTDDRDAMLEQIAGLFRATPEEVLASPYAFVGSTGDIADQMRAARDRWGFSYFILQGDVYEAMAPVVAELSGT